MAKDIFGASYNSTSRGKKKGEGGVMAPQVWAPQVFWGRRAQFAGARRVRALAQASQAKTQQNTTSMHLDAMHDSR